MAFLLVVTIRSTSCLNLASTGLNPPSRMNPFKILSFLLIAGLLSAEPLYTREGEDPSFAAVLESGAIKPGERFSKGPVTGSRIDVDNGLLEKRIGKTGPIPKDIGIHTQGSGGIKRKAKGKDHEISFRWGMYCGSKKGLTIHKDALLFVTGATIR